MNRIKVRFFGPFRDLFGGRELEIDLPAGFRILDLLRRLSNTPERSEGVFSAADDLHPYVVVMKNGTPVQGPDGMKSLLQEGDVIAVFPFLGGG